MKTTGEKIRDRRITLNMTPYQYDFISNYIVAHCPNVKIK